MNSLKDRAKTIVDLADSAKVYIDTPSNYSEDCSKYATENHLSLLNEVINIIENIDPLEEHPLCDSVKTLSKDKGVKLVEIAQAIRAALCGKLVSPSVFEIVEILGKEESISRIKKYISYFEK